MNLCLRIYAYEFTRPVLVTQKPNYKIPITISPHKKAFISTTTNLVASFKRQIIIANSVLDLFNLITN